VLLKKTFARCARQTTMSVTVTSMCGRRRIKRNLFHDVIQCHDACKTEE
jgi:hypothetical protein